ncbi:expressed unknown protein [Seminavis robusta]|uniref:Uncharacterized protein n=1 Tax=Seminavis robusta TaxID=568900 RepID=A0A9N8HWD3_9STRA|nr:expressed unknown protein [Seminavis robusta]|eukprot:Sro1634_g287480.1 n/a (366) ;mRNA; f:14423-15520
MYSHARHAPSEDGPTRPIRLLFPVLEHPDQRVEQAPVRMRERFYEAADEEAAIDYFEPLNIFWDEGNTNVGTRSQPPPLQQPPPPPPQQEPQHIPLTNNDTEPQRRRRDGCFDSSSNVILAAVVLIMCTIVAITIGEVCSSRQCGGGNNGKTVGSDDKPIIDIFWITDPPTDSPTQSPIVSTISSLAPTMIGSPATFHQDNPINNNNEEEEEGIQGDSGNIFLHTPTPVPTQFPVRDDATNDNSVNSTTETNTTTISNESDKNTQAPTSEVLVVESYNGTDLAAIINNNTITHNSAALSLNYTNTTTTSAFIINATTNSSITFVEYNATKLDEANNATASETANITVTASMESIAIQIKKQRLDP